MTGPVLVTGAAGQLGTVIVQTFDELGVVAPSRADLDITDRAAVERAVAIARPRIVVNCAAWNDVDGAESAPVAALEANAFAVAGLARAAAACGATLVTYSTDFVFDGNATTPYTEADAPNPRSVYAASKLLGRYRAALDVRRTVTADLARIGAASPTSKK